MSGGIAQLVAIGAQDAHLVGQPEVSFFRSNYKRHTNFAQTVERQAVQGNPTANGMSSIRFERKGDMLGYVYISPRAGTSTTSGDWWKSISKVELLIGGQVIDTQECCILPIRSPHGPFRKVVPKQVVLLLLPKHHPEGFTHSGFRFAKTPNPRSHWSRSNTTMLN